MVQIIEADRPFKRFSEGAGNLADAFGKYLSGRREDAALEKQGYNVKGVADPKTRQLLLEQQIKSKQSLGETDSERTTIDNISRILGPVTGQLYEHATEGGRTKIIDVSLNALMNNQRFEDALAAHLQKNPEDIKDFIPQQQPEKMVAQPTGGQVVSEEIPNEATPNLPKNLPSKAPKFSQKQTVTAQQEYAASEAKRAADIIKEADQLRKDKHIQQANIDLIRSAVKEGNIGGLDQDYVADILHFEPLRTAKGAQLKSAGKDYFIKTIQGLGRQPNQWIEQQIGSALVQLGKTPAANLTIAEMGQFQQDINDKKIEIVDRLQEKYENEIGFVPGRIGREIDKELGEYAEKRQNELAYDLRKIYEAEQGPEKLRQVKSVPKGTPLTREMAKIIFDKTDPNKSIEMRKKEAEQKAKKIGFTIPEPEIYSRAPK